VAWHITHGYTTNMTLPSTALASSASSGPQRKLLGRALLTESSVAAAEGPNGRRLNHEAYLGDVVAQFWPPNPLPEQRECCSKHPHLDDVDWDQCFMQTLMSPNTTDAGLKQIAASGGIEALAKYIKSSNCK
jgi:hypothetical protein